MIAYDDISEAMLKRRQYRSFFVSQSVRQSVVGLYVSQAVSQSFRRSMCCFVFSWGKTNDFWVSRRANLGPPDMDVNFQEENR